MRLPPDFACKTTTPEHSTDPHYPPHKKHKAEDPASLATTVEIAERKAQTVLNDKMLLKKT